MQHLLLAMLSLFVSNVAAAPTVVELRSPAISESGVLVQDVGIETLGGVFTPLLKRGCNVPCTITQVFSTADDNQSEIKITIVRGSAQLAKDGHRLGTFAILGIPPEPRGKPAVAVTFTVSREQIVVEAFDNHASRPLAIQRREF
jgi:molecular chaperone DnaK (HSP70)